MSVITTLFGRQESTSREVAKNRLQLVLLHDRVDLSPGLMRQMKDDLVDVISKYVEIDVDGVEVSLSQNRRESCLTASIPVVGSRQKKRNR
jgi:cell division topological specificity factor